MNVETLFLQFSVDKLPQLTASRSAWGSSMKYQIWARGGQNENAIGNLVLHLTGNVRQWILSAFGTNLDLRDRDSEFAARGGFTAPELSKNLRHTVEQAAQIIAGLDAAKLTGTYEIQRYDVSGLEAVYHAVEHFAEHNCPT
jgi:hypothetical protein